MGGFVLYVENLLEGLTTLGGASTDGVNDTSGTLTAPFACDSDAATLFTPTTSGSGAKDFDINLPAWATGIEVDAVLFDNVRGLTGTVTVNTRPTWGGAKASKGSFSAPSSRSFLYRLNTRAASEFWTVTFGTTSTALSIGSIRLLSTQGRIALTARSAPRRPINRGLSPAEARIELAGGAALRQIVGGVSQAWGFDVELLGGGSQAWDTLEAFYYSKRGLAGGVALVPDTHPDTANSVGVAYDCELLGGLPAAIVEAGPGFLASLELQQRSYGVDL